jgi:hypothetical protein
MASKDSNSLVISLSIFVLLTVGLGIAWYFTWDHSADLQRQLADSTKAEANSKSAIQGLQGEVASLKELIGRPGATDEVVAGAKAQIAARAGDGSAAARPLEEAMTKNAVDRDINALTANERLAQTNAKIAELNALVVSHEGSMKSVKDELDKKEAELREKERLHGEQLLQREKQIDELKTQLTSVQDEYATFRTTTERSIEELEKEISQQRQALITLRREKMKLEGLTFERPDGNLTFVDQDALTCYVDIGSRDELRIGTTFSVYAKNNSGVGRSQSDKDLKGKIEIVGLLGDHLAEARIVDQKVSDPLASGDPIYSPLFWPGQKLQIAVVGMLDFDGNPGSDREEFKRIVSGAGAEIALEINDEGKIIGKSGEELSASDIPNRITSATRFLLVGDLGDESTADTAQKEIYNRIRSHKEDMTDAAENNGVYVLSLSSFLDYIGYTSKRLVFTPTKRFPGVLANGAKSGVVNGALGNRESSGTTSGAFSKRRSRPMISTGTTSKLYQNSNADE